MPDPAFPTRYSIHDRASKVSVADFAPAPEPLHGFLERLPGLLAGDALREVVGAVAEARRRGRPVVLMMGAHVVKCGLSRVVGELLRRGIVTAVASNGATLIHDTEIALWGKTSEDVEASLPAGAFGWA